MHIKLCIHVHKSIKLHIRNYLLPENGTSRVANIQINGINSMIYGFIILLLLDLGIKIVHSH